MCFYFSHTNRKLVKPYQIPSFEPSSTWFQCFYPGVNLYSQLPWCPTIKQIDRVSFWRWCFRSWGSEDRLSHLWFFKFEKHHLNLERECIEEEGQGRKPCCIIGRSLSPQSTGRNSSSPQARSDSLHRKSNPGMLCGGQVRELSVPTELALAPTELVWESSSSWLLTQVGLRAECCDQCKVLSVLNSIPSS